MEILSSMVCQRLSVLAILEANFSNQFVQCIFSRTRFLKLIDGPTLSFMRPYDEQRPRNTFAPTYTVCNKRKSCLSPKFQSTQCMYILLLSQVMIMSKQKQQVQVLVAPRHIVEKCMQCSAACGIQNLKRNIPFWIRVTNFSFQ